MARGRDPVKRFFFLMMLLTALTPTPGHAGLSLQIDRLHPPQVLWQSPITTNRQFTLVHRNSIFGVQVWEAFQIDPDGRLWLKEIKTDSPSVLEYYGLEESRKGWIEQVRKIDSLKIRVTASGEFWLDFNQEKINLSQGVPDGTLLEIRIREVRE